MPKTPSFTVQAQLALIKGSATYTERVVGACLRSLKGVSPAPDEKPSRRTRPGKTAQAKQSKPKQLQPPCHDAALDGHYGRRLHDVDIERL